MRFKQFILSVSLLTLFLTTQTWAGNLTVRAYLNRNDVSVGGQFTLSVQASGSQANKIASPQLPDISKFARFMGSSSSQSIQFINGRMSASKTLIYYFRAIRPGSFTIPPIKVTVKGKTYETNPVSIMIRRSAVSRQPPAAGRSAPPQKPETGMQTKPNLGGALFLRALVNKREVYQNEPIILTYRIYTRVSVTGYGIKALPKTVGFWAEEIPMPRQPQTREEIVNGVKYMVADLKKMVLFPTDPGKKVIDPMEVTCQVRMRNSRPSRDIFDNFFNDDFFGREVEKNIRSKPITINVLPFPKAGRPADFSGAVGRFNMTVKVNKDSVKTNETVTMTVKISGSGNIKMLPAPKFNVPPDFERYAPKITEKINRSTRGVSGFKRFEYVFIPRFPGKQRIAPISFSYFDPARKAYRTITSSEFLIHVKPGAESLISLGEGLSKEEVQLVGKDIRFIKTTSPKFQKIDRYFYGSPLFWLIVFLPLAALGGAFGYRRYQDRLEENVAFARSQRANQLAKKRLQKAKKVLSEDTQKEFFAEISRAMLGFLGDKFNLPTAGIMTDQVEKLMRDRHADEETIQKYLKCLQICDFQRFAPANSSIEEMQSCYEAAGQAIIQLEKAI